MVKSTGKESIAQAITDKRTLPQELQELRTAIFLNAINKTQDKLRRDTALMEYVIAATETLREVNSKLVYHLMEDLAYNLGGKDSFTKACKMIGVEVPPAVETKHTRKAKSDDAQVKAA